MTPSARGPREGWASFVVHESSAPREVRMWRGSGQEGLVALGRREGEYQELLVWGRWTPRTVYSGEVLTAPVPPSALPRFLEHPSWAGHAAAMVPEVTGFTWQGVPLLESGTAAQQVWYVKARSDTDPGTWLRAWITVRFMDPVVDFRFGVVYSNLDSDSFIGPVAPRLTWPEGVSMRPVFSQLHPTPMQFGTPRVGIALLTHEDARLQHADMVWARPRPESMTKWVPELEFHVWPPANVLDEPWNATWESGDGPLRQVDGPPGTGDRWVFGEARGQAALVQPPSKIEALAVSTMNEFRRPSYYLERDGTPFRHLQHPDLRTLGGCPDPRNFLNRPPDTLGKPREWWPQPDLGVHDGSHAALQGVIGYYLLTLDPLAKWILDAHCELLLAHLDDPPRRLDQSYGPPRGLGRSGLWHPAAFAVLFPERRDQCIAHAVRAAEIYAQALLDQNSPVAVLQHTDDPRLLGALQGYRRAWFPWQECLAIQGLYALWRVSPGSITDPVKDAFRRNMETVLREGFWRNTDGRIGLNWIVGYQNGQPVGATHFNDAWAPHLKDVQRIAADSGGGILAMLTMAPAVRMAAENPFQNLAPELVARARAILQQIPVNTHKAHGWIGCFPPL
jgi:hypothetical protein